MIFLSPAEEIVYVRKNKASSTVDVEECESSTGEGRAESVECLILRIENFDDGGFVTVNIPWATGRSVATSNISIRPYHSIF